MFNIIGRLVFTSTALAPVGFTYAWANYNSNRRAAIIAMCVSISLVIISATFIKLASREFERVTVKPGSVEAADKENVAFLLLYLSPLFTASFSQLNWSLLLPTFIVFTAVVATGYNYHSSPLLGLMGWHAYRVADQSGVTYVVFTRKQMRSTLDAMTAVQLTEYVLLDVG